MYNRTIIISICLIIFYSCLPLPQHKLLSKSSDISAQYDEEGYFKIWIDKQTWIRDLRLIDNLSYAIHEDDKKYNIQSEEQVDSPRYRSYKIFIVNEKGNITTALKAGIWEIYLHLQKGDKVQEEAIKFRLWTFYYNPLIHGAPN